MMNRLVKILFFALIVKPVVFVVLGLNVVGRKNLPQQGPAIIAANHNSHLDTMVLMSLFPLSKIHHIRPVAAADYFMRNRFMKWFSLNCIGIIPLDRSGKTHKDALFTVCHEALDHGDILIIFPEGSRGEAEKMGRLRKGLFHLHKDRKNTHITPVVLHGLGRTLPRGEALLVPYNCDVVIGEHLQLASDSVTFTQNLSQTYDHLLEHCLTRST